VLCSVLAETSKELVKCESSTPCEGVTVADQHAARCFHAFAALLSIIAGDTASPPQWHVHKRALPYIKLALDALVGAHNGAFAKVRERMAAVRTGSHLYDALHVQLQLPDSDGGKAKDKGFSLPMPPPCSRLSWMERSAMISEVDFPDHVAILVRRGVPLFPQLPLSSVGSPRVLSTRGGAVRALPRRPLPILTQGMRSARSGLATPGATS